MATTVLYDEAGDLPTGGLKVRDSSGFFDNITSALSSPFMDDHAATKKVVQWTAFVYATIFAVIGLWIGRRRGEMGRDKILGV